MYGTKFAHAFPPSNTPVAVCGEGWMYGKLHHAVTPSPILSLWVSLSYPGSPAARTGPQGLGEDNHSAAVPRRNLNLTIWVVHCPADIYTSQTIEFAFPPSHTTAASVSGAPPSRISQDSVAGVPPSKMFGQPIAAQTRVQIDPIEKISRAPFVNPLVCGVSRRTLVGFAQYPFTTAVRRVD